MSKRVQRKIQRGPKDRCARDKYSNSESALVMPLPHKSSPESWYQYLYCKIPRRLPEISPISKRRDPKSLQLSRPPSDPRENQNWNPYSNWEWGKTRGEPRDPLRNFLKTELWLEDSSSHNLTKSPEPQGTPRRNGPTSQDMGSFQWHLQERCSPITEGWLKEDNHREGTLRISLSNGENDILRCLPTGVESPSRITTGYRPMVPRRSLTTHQLPRVEGRLQHPVIDPSILRSGRHETFHG